MDTSSVFNPDFPKQRGVFIDLSKFDTQTQKGVIGIVDYPTWRAKVGQVGEDKVLKIPEDTVVTTVESYAQLHELEKANNWVICDKPRYVKPRTVQEIVEDKKASDEDSF